MGVLGEASSSEVNVPIKELGDTGSGDTAVGALILTFCLQVNHIILYRH